MPTAPEDPWLGTTSPVPADRLAIPISVSRATVSGSTWTYQALPNLRATEVVWRIGANPATARFRYVFNNDDMESPQSVEDALGIGSSFPNVVNVGDRLVIFATKPDEDETQVPLFDGFPYEFVMELEDGVEVVYLVAVGIAVRLRDSPIAGAILRDASQPTLATNHFQSDLVARFNPRGQANATDAGSSYDPGTSGAADWKYPLFLDPEVCKDRSIGLPWTLPMAARYLIFSNNAPSPQWVQNPNGTDLDALLIAREPIAMTAYDPGNPATYTAKDIRIGDRPLTGRDWTGLLEELTKDKGFGMSLDLAADDDGNPQTTLRPFHLQLGERKHVYLPIQGSTFDPETCNLGSAQASRDLDPLVNCWEVQGHPLRHEGTFILKPGFPSASADSASDSARAAFRDDGDPAKTEYYRHFVLNEAGDGYYLEGSAAKVSTVPSLDVIFGSGNYTPNRRKPHGELISTDAAGVSRRAILEISTDYTGTTPGVSDRSGHWQQVGGGWELLKDRVGIRINVDDPNKWNIGQTTEANAPFPVGVVRVVESIGNPGASSGAPKFTLRVTVVIEGDKALKCTASPTTETMMSQTVKRVVDARDRYRKDTVCESSAFNDGSPDQIVRDDTDAAQAEADSMRETTENGLFGGAVTIPRFTMFYGIGDCITAINGRNLSFRLDGGGTSNAPVYPVVEEIRWELEGRQTTSLTLADELAHARRSKAGHVRPKRNRS